MTTNLNVPPYYDDFDASKDFHQVLFKPGYSIQARELTQIQSIIRNQIAKFGDSIYQHGSVVIPGNSYADLTTPYVSLQTFYSSVLVDVTQWVGKIAVGVNSGLRAMVKQVDTSTGPRLFLAYLNGGGSGTTAINTFAASEEIYLESNTSIRATALASNPTGFGSVAYVNKGVYYINGSFVSVASQSVVIDPSTSTPSCHVMLRIDETIVDSTQDSTLLDPAQGSYNYAAPGADRIKISLTLVSLPLVAAVTDNYVEIMRYSSGTLQEHSRYPKYSELEKSLARRTFDEAGDYIVNGLQTTLKEHLRTQWNAGMYDTGSADKFVAVVAPGKAYVRGFEVENLAADYIALDKARTAAHVKVASSTMQVAYGRYMYVTALLGMPDFKNRSQIILWNDNDYANGSATQVGTARVLGIDFVAGDPTLATAIYKLYYTDLVMVGGYTLADVGGIRSTGALPAWLVTGSMAVLNQYSVPNASKDFTYGELVNNADSSRSATVHRYNRPDSTLYVFKHDHTKSIPNVGEIITGATSTGVATVKTRVNSVTQGVSSLFNVPVSSIKSTKNGSNVYDIKYTVWKTLTINTNSSGNGSATITDGTFRTPDTGLTVAASSTGIVNVSLFSLSSGTTLNLTGGPVSTTVIVTTQVDKSAIQAKTKTLTQTTLSSVVPATTISLGKADIYNIVSIFAGATDVTNRYVLDNGQTDYAYGVGTLNLIGTLPTSNLTIIFNYFAHSGTGDYFSVDSYTTLGSNYIALVPNYRSKTTSDIYDLSNMLDFRPRIGDDGTYNAGTALMNDPLVLDTIMTTSAQYFVPRIDVLYMDTTGTVLVKNGIPDTAPIKPAVPDGVIVLATLTIPAYTNNLSDIGVFRNRIDRMTMSDIQGLKKRIENIEYYSTLSTVESNVVNYNIPDAVTGLNRYKTGYLVDSFTNQFAVCDYYNQFNRGSFIGGVFSAIQEHHDADLTVSAGTSTNYQMTGTQISLPYTEAALIKQGYSTRTTNLNNFLVFSWQGHMTLTPAMDSWVVTDPLPVVLDPVADVVPVSIPQVVAVTATPTPPTPYLSYFSTPVTNSTFSIGDVTVNEGDGTATLNVTRWGATWKATQISYFTTAGTATAGADYTTTGGVLNFAANVTNMQIAVPILQDTAVEGSETFTVGLFQFQGGDVLQNATATVTILDDDSTLATVLNTPFFATTNEGTTKVITVTRSGNVSGTSTVNYTTTNGTALAGSDYTTTSGTLSFGPAVTSQTISVPITADAATEGNEYFNIIFSSLVNCTFGVGGSGVQVLINDTSVGTPSSVNITQAVTCNESDGSISVTVTKTGTTACTINYSTSSGGATSGSDFTATSGTLTFTTAPSESQTITVPIIDDAILEGNESFVISLTPGTGSPVITHATCNVTILANDSLPPLAYQPQPAPVVIGSIYGTMYAYGPGNTQIITLKDTTTTIVVPPVPAVAAPLATPATNVAPVTVVSGGAAKTTNWRIAQL